jgi:hypothetical protein
VALICRRNVCCLSFIRRAADPCFCIVCVQKLIADWVPRDQLRIATRNCQLMNEKYTTLLAKFSKNAVQSQTLW